MTEKIAYSQETSVELSEQDLDAVAGGVAFSFADAAGIAFGDNFAATTNKTATQVLSVGNFNLALGTSNSASIAG